MYPKNAASPEPIAIGPVVQISDGAVQTAGVTVRIKPIGVAEADGVGTTAYSTDGIVLYTPTQAETNYTSFILIAKKTACIPANITVITTSSVTPGTVLLAPVTHTGAAIAAANITQIDGSATAAQNLSLSALQILPATVDETTTPHTATATEFQTSSIAAGANDQFVGRVIIFTSGPLLSQARPITSSESVSGVLQFTVQALTEAPSDGETFLMI